jgi:DNA-binding winged helix-turn-helix (wHTH) protein/TolB-like protein
LCATNKLFVWGIKPHAGRRSLEFSLQFHSNLYRRLMDAGISNVWQFGEFRLDVNRKVLWYQDNTVPMPLKELEVLAILVRNSGELVTKEELIDQIWGNSFVEESNLSRHVYLLRKTLKELGSAETMIETVPRRGYRFSGEAWPTDADEVVIQRHTRTHSRTLIEFQEPTVPATAAWGHRRLAALATIVAILAGASAFLGSRYLARPDPPIRSIGVVPFKMFGTDPSTSHAGTGLADILTTRLSNLKNVSVRPSGAGVGLTDLDALAAAERLQVDAVLEGTIYYIGDRVRVTARLVRSGDASIAWSGEFDKARRDELQLQNELAMQIVPVLASNLSGGEQEALATQYTKSRDAYELYIRGRYEWNRRNTSGIIEAQRLFRNAIEADPGFALAYVGLGDSLMMNQAQIAEVPLLITRALELDPNLGEAYATRGFYQMFFDWEWQKAEESFKRSLELNPNYATAHHWYATLLAIKGDTAAAKDEMHRALELNPLSHNFLADLGQLHYFSGEYAEAESYCLKSLEIDPDFSFAHEYLHNIYLKTGEYEKAVVEIAKADAINGRFTHEVQKKVEEPMGKFRTAFRESGIKGYLDYRFPGAATSPEQFYFYAMKHAITGEREKALEYLEKSTDARMFLSAFLKAEPVFEELRSEPRFQRILRKMHLG